MKNKFNLNDILLIGRTFDEYFRMFNLQDIDLTKEKIHDAAGGIASFNSEASAKGYNVITGDQIYNLNLKDIKKKSIDDLTLIKTKLPELKNKYKWNYYKNPTDLYRYRQKAADIFIKDYKINNKKYVPTTYPGSTFKTNQFTLTLVSHFLFLYDEQLNYEFHLKTIQELLRITSKEIRIFPLINLNFERSVHLDKIISDPSLKCFSIEILKVDFEFLTNGNELLKISKK